MPQSTKLRVTPVQVPTPEHSSQHTDLGLIILFTASGASGLMLEVVWSRMLGWSLGATTWSVMTVLVAYLGGLGLGGIFWGLRAHRSLRPLRLFGWLECAIGLYALTVPAMFGWLGRFRRLARDYERLGEILAGWHWLAFVGLLLGRLGLSSA